MKLMSKLMGAAAFAALGNRVGLHDADRFEPTAAAFGYAAYKAWLICYGSAAQIACARALNLSASVLVIANALAVLTIPVWILIIRSLT